MNRAELLALAERCEKAEGRDLVLDADITEAMHPELRSAPWERVSYLSGRAVTFADRSDPDNLNVVSPPRFTASLDAALALVPEGWECALYWGVRGFPPQAQLEPCDTREFQIDGVAVSPALALCAAALRARAVKEGRDG